MKSSPPDQPPADDSGQRNSGCDHDEAMITARVPGRLYDAVARRSLHDRKSMSEIIRTALAKFLGMSL